MIKVDVKVKDNKYLGMEGVLVKNITTEKVICSGSKLLSVAVSKPL
jgi:hypothetical protein